MAWDEAQHPRHPAGTGEGGEFAAGTGVILNEAERRSLVAQGLYLHGSSHKFEKGEAFKPGGHGAIYFSDPGRDPSRVTQAEHGASGPFGGFLYAVRIDASKLKAFDPPNDPRAHAIIESIHPRSQPAFPAGKKHYWVEYPDMPDVVKASAPYGYNDFHVREPAVQGFSRAITNPNALTIVLGYKKQGT